MPRAFCHLQARIAPEIEERIEGIVKRLNWSKNAPTVEILRRGLESLDRGDDDRSVKVVASN
jgi:hypothetical protein